MKKLALLLLLTVVSTLGFTQTPQQLKYQAIIRDNSGSFMPGHTISLKFTILQNNENGSIVYSEYHQLTTNQFGLATVDIGGGNYI